ncbi:Pentatricopeptide repeat-containing protein, mitochondrial [Sesamum alatum]|uniref:Pentatricopeptide repeat-containing protein, mitochondrial n=1 Tax=Sesamum alatum TaxID=300844 RepID=A0AAE2CAG1_9LAMI|nr:Pentatricopeptide repeat-containing protein, mitochondrial [Sesamum alatum]
MHHLLIKRCLSTSPSAITFLNSNVKRLVSDRLYEEALAFYAQYVHPFQLHSNTAFIVPSITKACALSQSHQILGMQIHCNVIKNGFEEFTISNSLLSMYAKFWDTKSAFKVFDEMPSRDTVSWNSMINCYTQNGCLLEALKMFRDMHAHGFVPKPELVASCLSTCVKSENWRLGRAIHALVLLDERMEYSSFVATALVDFYWKFDDPNMASRVFDRVVEKNEVSWTAMISGCVEYHDHVRAFACLRAMQCEGVKPNRVTLISVLPACGELRSVKRGKEIHAYAVRHGYGLDAQFSSTLVHMYCECGGALQMARLIFDRSMKKEIVMWSSMIAGYSRSKDRVREAMRLFNEMQMEGILPNTVTLLAMISALLSTCNHSGLVEEGQELFDRAMKDINVSLTIEHYACYIDLLGRAGKIQAAYDIVCGMPTKPSPRILSSLVSASKLHGRLDIAESLVHVLIRTEPENPANHTLLSMVYAESDNWPGVEEVRRYMEERNLKKNRSFSRI